MLDKITVTTWNARGIKNKSIELFQFLINCKIDVCLVSETWLKPNMCLNHEKFFIYRNDRENMRGGGVAIIIRKNIPHQLLPIVNTTLIENIGIKILTNSDFIDIFSCYFPGGRVGINGYRKQLFASDLNKLSRGEKFILGGDFNSRHQSWGCVRANCWGNLLFQKQDSYNFDIVHPDEHTYDPSNINRQGSTLDFFITNVPEILSSAVVVNDLSSDHLPVKVTYNRNVRKMEFLLYDFQNANWNAFAMFINRRLAIPNLSSVLNTEDIDSLWAVFKRILNDAIASSVPKKT